MNPRTPLLLILCLCTCVRAQTLRAQTAPPLEGLASYYADRFHLKPTSTGEKYDKNGYMAASKTLPFGTRVQVTNTTSGESVEVRINDCGPHRDDRIIDLSRKAAEEIGITKAGVAMVQLKVLELGELGPTCHRAAWAKANKRKAEQAARRAKAVPQTVVLGAPGATVPPSAGPPPTASRGGTVAPPPPTVPGAPAPATYGTEIPVATDIPAAPTTATVPAGPAPATYGTGGEVTPPPPAPTPAPATTPTQTNRKPPSSPTPTQFAPDDILFGVQIGAFGKKENAERVAANLRAGNFPEVQLIQVGKIYRVFAGKFYFQNQARELRDELREAGIAEATVRRIQ